MTRRRSSRSAGIALLVMTVALGGCSTLRAAGTSSSTSVPRANSNPPVAEIVSGPEVATPSSIRDGDTTDVAVLAATVAADAAGDQEWIGIFADLRARSWLATRYPGSYELDEIYVEEWAIDHAAVLERESLDLGVYLDEPLPILLSVVPTRELGELVELEVVLEAGAATIRRDDDDTALGILPGGRQRGLFTLGHQGTTDRWRIHSVTELTVIENAETGGSDQ